MFVQEFFQSHYKHPIECHSQNHLDRSDVFWTYDSNRYTHQNLAHVIPWNTQYYHMEMYLIVVYRQMPRKSIQCFLLEAFQRKLLLLHVME